jgi:hypothetical protein
VLGPVIYFAETGLQTIRIQTSEDGLAIDRIVLSSQRFMNRWLGCTQERHHHP